MSFPLFFVFIPVDNAELRLRRCRWSLFVVLTALLRFLLSVPRRCYYRRRVRRDENLPAKKTMKMKNGLGDLKKRRGTAVVVSFRIFSLLSRPHCLLQAVASFLRIPTLSRVLCNSHSRSKFVAAVLGVNFSLLFPHPPLFPPPRRTGFFLAVEPGVSKSAEDDDRFSRPSSAVVRSKQHHIFSLSIIALLLLLLSIRAGISYNMRIKHTRCAFVQRLLLLKLSLSTFVCVKEKNEHTVDTFFCSNSYTRKSKKMSAFFLHSSN